MIIILSVMSYLTWLIFRNKMGFILYQLLCATTYLVSLSFIQTLDITLPIYFVFSALPFLKSFKANHLFSLTVLLYFSAVILISLLINSVNSVISIFIIRLAGILLFYYIFSHVDFKLKAKPWHLALSFACEILLTVIGFALSKDYRLMLNFQCTVGCIATGFVLLLAYDFYKNQKRFSLVLMLLHTLIACLSGTRGYMLVCIVVTMTSILLFSSLKQKLVALPLLLAGVLMERFNVMEFIFHSLRFGESTGRRQSEDLFVIRFMPKRPLFNILFGNGFGSPIGKYRISRSIIYEVADSRYTLKVLPKVEGFHNCWSTILYSSGIVGLILIVLLYGSIILQAMRAATDNRFRMILLSFLVSYAVLLWFRWTATSGILEFACLSYVIHDLKNHSAGQLSLSRAESCQIQKKTEERSWTSYSP